MPETEPTASPPLQPWPQTWATPQLVVQKPPNTWAWARHAHLSFLTPQVLSGLPRLYRGGTLSGTFAYFWNKSTSIFLADRGRNTCNLEPLSSTWNKELELLGAGVRVGAATQQNLSHAERAGGL